MSISRAAKLCGARLSGKCEPETALGSVVIDSRLVKKGDLFVAYKGEKTDGHDYISAALDKGAACALAQRKPEGEGRCVMLSEDVQTALESICAGCRDDVHIPLVGITGSVGKTTAKEMIASVLSTGMKVLKTEGNLNNQIGVPITLSRITQEHEAGVIEMGVSKPGDMAVLGKMVRPNIMVFSVIGHAHLEFLHDLDGVFREKTSVLDYMPEDGLAIINGDDPYQRRLRCKQRIISYGMSAECTLRGENIRYTSQGGTEFDMTYQGRSIHVQVPAYGQHMVYAAMEGAAVGFAMGFSDADILRGIAAYETLGGRAAVTRTPCLTLVDDSYNANPDSMKCAIDSLKDVTGRRVCILGDMLEMGEDSPELHRQIGRYAADADVEIALSCGEFSRKIVEGFGKGGLCYENADALIADLPNRIQKGDTVLVKASRGARFEYISEALKSLKLE